MSSKKLSNVLRPLTTYVNVTVVDPCTAIAQAGKDAMRDSYIYNRSVKNKQTKFKTVAKQQPDNLSGINPSYQVEEDGKLSPSIMNSREQNSSSKIGWVPVI